MGHTEVGRMSLWEYAASVEGWNRAQSPEELPDKLSASEADALAGLLDEPPVWAN